MSFAATIINLVTSSTAIKSAVKTATKESDSFFERAIESITGQNIIPDEKPKSLITALTTQSKNKSINDILGPDKFIKFNNPNLKKFVNPQFEEFSKKFINSEPELLFICEYFVEEKSVGLLLVWERFSDATHYEVFKKNIFKVDSKFERVLFLDSVSLEEETTYYLDYIQKTLGLSVNPDEVFIILDTTIKEDRIYEYRIRSARVPKGATEVDYDFILEGKALTKQVSVDDVSINTLFDVAGVTLGSKNLAWTIALTNETVPFFGRGPSEKPLSSFPLPLDEDQDKFILIANNSQDILKIFNESISLFDLKETVTNLINGLGGLPVDFRTSFLDSVDEIAKTFSYDFFKKQIRIKSPVFNLVLNVAETASSKKTSVTNRLSKLSIDLPSQTGAESFSSIEKLTKILIFVNEVFLAVIYAQEDTGRLQVILDELKALPDPQDTVAQAVAVVQTPPVVATAIDVSSILTANGASAVLSAIPQEVGFVATAVQTAVPIAIAASAPAVTAIAATPTVTATPVATTTSTSRVSTATVFEEIAIVSAPLRLAESSVVSVSAVIGKVRSY